jgi:Nucleotidyltransferase domain
MKFYASVFGGRPSRGAPGASRIARFLRDILACRLGKSNYADWWLNVAFITARELQNEAFELYVQMNIHDDLRAALLYFDVFDYPLTENELFTFMPARLEFDEFRAGLKEASLPASDGLFYLRPHRDLAGIRRARERKAKRMLAAASLVTLIVRRFPFVRGVFLSGSLSKGVNDGGADIDLFIVSAENRLWICRSILTSFKKVFLLNSKKFLCPNYFVTEGHLEIPEKNIFTATELVTLRPLYNPDIFSKLISANSWLYAFFPNFAVPQEEHGLRRSLIQRALEVPMSDGYTAKMDRRLMGFYRSLWKRRYPGYTDMERDFLFRSTPFSSKVHPNDYQSKILNVYERRLREEGLTRLTRLNG